MYAVQGRGELFGRIDDRVEEGDVGNELGRFHDGVVAQDEDSSEPHDDDNDNRAQKFAHGMGERTSPHEAVHDAAVVLVVVGKDSLHFFFGVERLDDPEAGEGFLDVGEDLAHFVLSFLGTFLQGFSDFPDEGAHDGKKDEHEEGELPAHENHGGEVDEYEYGVLEKHFQRVHDGVFHFLHVPGGAGDDVALAFFGKEGKGKGQDFVVNQFADIPDDSVPDVNNFVRGHVGATCFKERGQGEESTGDEQGGLRGKLRFAEGDVVIEVVHQAFLRQGERHGLPDFLVEAEQDVQHGNQNHKGYGTENRRENVVQDVFHEPHFIRRDESF